MIRIVTQLLYNYHYHIHVTCKKRIRIPFLQEDNYFQLKSSSKTYEDEYNQAGKSYFKIYGKRHLNHLIENHKYTKHAFIVRGKNLRHLKFHSMSQWTWLSIEFFEKNMSHACLITLEFHK